jgi:signal transduction histidine kinase/CheY-like chemotaxis protein
VSPDERRPLIEAFLVGPDPMWSLVEVPGATPRDFELVWFNPAFAQMVEASFGVSATTGATLVALPPEIAAVHRKAYSQVLDEGATRFDWAANPDQVWDVMLRRIEQDGAVVGIAAHAHDVSARRRTQQELTSVRSRVDRAERARSDFLASISHELRTPLNAIVGMASALRERTTDPDTARLASALHGNAAALNGLVTDLLEFSKIEAGLLDVVPETVDVAALVRRTADEVRPRAEARGLTLSVVVREGVPERVEVDPRRLRQVVHHLVSNAVQYTDVGSVTVVLKCVVIEGEHATLELAVRDTGVGISEREQRLIFTRFYRSQRTSDRAAGTGLGLAFTRALLGLMGGGIRVRSTPGDGSVFRARFQVGMLTEHVDRTPSRPVGLWRPAHILVADDHPANLQVLRRILLQRGDHVEAASDGAEALDRVSAGRWDLVLMDVDMAPMDGVRATTEIRAREALLGLPRVPIVAVTAHAVPEVRYRCEASGMDDFLIKPVDPARLARTVERWVDRTARILVHTREQPAATGLVSELEAAGASILAVATDGDLEAIPDPSSWDALVVWGSEPTVDLRTRGFDGPVLFVDGDVDRGAGGPGDPLPASGLVDALGAAFASPMEAFDPDVADLVPEYLEGRQRDLAALAPLMEARTWSQDERAQVKRVLHQIRGNGTSYGFPGLTALAQRGEAALAAADRDALCDVLRAMEAVVEDARLRGGAR